MTEETKDTIWTWVIIFILCLLFGLGFFKRAHGQTPREVYLYCDSIGIEHPEIVVKQSIEETGWYECTECSLDHNNIFGFRWKKKYLEFDHWKESCDYYLKWQNKWYKGQDYYEFLACLWKHRDGRCVPYATSKTYIAKVKSIEL